MKQVFKKIVTECCICKTPLQGYNLFKIGDKYYCVEHWQKENEKEYNRFQDRKEKIYKSLFNK